MACLTQLQIDNLFKHVGSYFKSLKDPVEYNHIDHFKYLYNLGINKNVKPETSLSFVQVLPELVNKYLALTNTKISKEEAVKLTMLSFDFGQFSLEQIGEYIGQVKQADIVEDKQDEVITEEVVETNESLPLFTALTDVVLSTTLQETLEFVEESAQLVKDPEKAWHHEFNRALIQRGISSTQGAFNTTLNGHRGFRLKAVKLSSIPFDELYSSLKQDKSEAEVKAIIESYKGVALVVTDNDGNLLRFNDKYEVDPNGKLVYFNMRDTRTDDLSALNSRGRIQSLEDIAKNYNISLEEAKNIIKAEVDKLRNIQKAVYEDKDVLLEIIGGTGGYIPSIIKPDIRDFYGAAPSTYGDIIDSFGITPIEIITEGQFKGKTFIYLNNGRLPVLLLNRNITNDEALKYAEAVHKLLKNNNYSQGAASTAATFLSQYIAYSTNEVNQLEQFLTNSTNTVQDIANNIVKKPDSKFNRFLAYQGNQSIYYGIVNGEIKQVTYNDYLNSWRDVYRTLLTKSANGKIEQFSSSLSFAPTSESSDIVNGTETEVVEKRNTSINFGAAGEINIEDLFKEKNITSAATKKQIKEAYDWWQSSPLNKVIAFNVLFDIVNSNAKAAFGRDGISLFFGSNYTDIYHEAWHGFSQLFLTKKQKIDLYNEVKSMSGSFVLPNGLRVNYKDASYRQIEELLAEDFRQYKLSGGKKVLGKRPVRNKIFRAILNFLDWLFDGVSFNQARTDYNSIKRVHDLYTKLDTGKIQDFKPAAKNALFTSLASPIGISTDTPLNETESVQVSESIDSIISDIMLQFAKQQGKSIFGDFLGSKNSIKTVYGIIKKTLEAKVEELQKDAIANDRAIFILNVALNNFGDIDTIIDSGDITGDSTIQFHLRRSKILDWKNKEFDDEAKEDSPDFRTQKEKADDGELSFEELANEKVLFLIRTLKSYKLEGNKYVPEKNALGFSKLTNYRKTLGSVINTVSNNTGAASIYNKLNEVKNKPEIQELLMKLGDYSPNKEIQDVNTFNSWVLFANTFNTSKLPMLITIIETTEEGEAKIYNVDASSSIIGIKNRMISKFKVNIFNDQFASMNNSTGEMVLNMQKIEDRFDAVFGTTAVNKSINKVGEAFNFFKAIGLPLDEELFDEYFLKDTNLERDIVKNAGYTYRELKAIVERNPTKFRGKLVPNHFDLLINGIEGDKEFQTQRGVIDGLLNLHLKVADEISSFSLTNAEGNREYENSLNSQISITQNNINESKTFEELYNKPGFEHLNPANNPMIKASQIFNRIFKNNIRVSDLNIRKFSGLQLVEDGMFKNGQSTIETDPVSKFYLEFYSYLTSGFTSNPTPSDKKTYLGFYSEDVDGDTRFIKPESFTDGTGLGDIRFQDIVFGYLKAEHERVYDLNKNTIPELSRIQYFSNYGKYFMIFDDILTPDIKDKLLNISPEELLQEQNADLVSDIKNEITEYINKLTAQNLEVFQKINFIDDEVIRRNTKIKGNFNSQALTENVVKAFTANTFIQYVESTILFYGDIVAYELLKEDFHKRDSASGSTGRTMITDPQFVRAFNKFYGSEYAKSEGFAYSFDEDGFINTAIFQEHNYENKELMAEYEKSWRKVYTEELKSLKKFTEKEIKEKVDLLIEKQLKPFTQDEVKEGDAQGWVTLDAYRYFSIMLNEWSPAHEDLYKKIVNRESVDEAKVLKVFSPKKFQYYGPISTSKYHVNALHKFSLLPLIPNVIKDTNLDLLHRRMMRDNIQYATFHSGSKIGTIKNEAGQFDKFYSEPSTRIMSNETLTPNKIHLRYLRNQVPINDYFKDKVVFSTQLRALIYNDLFNRGIPLNSNIGNLVKEYIDSIEAYVEASKEELKQEIDFNSSTGAYDAIKLSKIIKRELDRRDIPEHLQIAATSVTEDGFTFDISLARNSEDIEKILFSIANKRIVRRKLNGEPLIQAASTGFEQQRLTNPTKEQLKEYGGDELLFYRTNPTTGENLPMQVKIALQGKFKNLLGLEHPDGQKINTRERLNQAIKNKEWRDKYKEMIQLVGVRIPVQGHNSMEFMEVAEFLPEIAGPIVVLPSYIVAKAGSDYDIDKLSIFFPNISARSTYNLNSKNVKSITDNESLNEAFSKSKLSKKDTIKFIVDVITNKQKNYKLTADDKLIAAEIEKFREISDVKLSTDKLESLENDIIRNLIGIIKTPEVFEMMKKPNGTYLVQDFANDMVKYFETDYNPKKSFDNWDRSTVSQISSKFKVSPTRIFELMYNIYKQNANSVGKRALGIGANVNKIKALFNQVDFQLNKTYTHSRYVKKTRKIEYQERAIRILLQHNSTKEGNISLGSLYNVEGIKISDYLNQLMNGWLDVAKDPWIFYVMGTPELTPSLLYLVSAGTPFEEAVYFLAQPAVRKYIELVKKIDSPITKLDKSFNYKLEFAIKANLLRLEKGKSGHDLWNRQMGLINMEMQRTNGELFTKEYLQQKLDNSLTGELEFTTEDQAILAHFFEINDAAKAIARVQQSFNFDTKTSSTLFDTFKRAQKRDILLDDVDFEVNFAKMFPQDKLRALYSDTILGKFDISDIQTSLFGRLFPIRNNELLNSFLYDVYSNEVFFGSEFDTKIKQHLGSPEKFISEFKNDFTTAMMLKMLYDFKIEDNKYKGLDVVQVTRDVDIKDLGIEEKETPAFNTSKLFFATKNYTKDTPTQYPKFGFIFTENLEMLGTDKNVSTTQAVIRTDKEGNINRNALPLVTKKEQAANKFFEDTDEDFKLFVDTNTKLINTIADSKFERIIVPTGGFAMEKAKLPTRFAEWLQNELSTKLGISTNLVDRGNGYSGLSNPKSKSEIIKSIDKLNGLMYELQEFEERTRQFKVGDDIEVYFKNSDSESELEIKSFNKVTGGYRLVLKSGEKEYTYIVDNEGKGEKIEINEFGVFEVTPELLAQKEKLNSEIQKVWDSNKEDFLKSEAKQGEPPIVIITPNLTEFKISKATGIDGDGNTVRTEEEVEVGYKIETPGHPNTNLYLVPSKGNVQDVNTGRAIAYEDFLKGIKGTFTNLIPDTRQANVAIEIGFDVSKIYTTNQPKVEVPVVKEKGQPKFVTTGTFVKDDNIYIDVNRLSEIFKGLDDNVDTVKVVDGIMIKYPPKKAFRSFTEFVNYSLEKEYLRSVFGKQEINEVAFRIARTYASSKAKLNENIFKVTKQYNLQQNKNAYALYQTGGAVVQNKFGLLDLVDTTTGEVVISNFRITGRGSYAKITEYEVDPVNLTAEAIETYLMDKALKNINNVYSYTQHTGLDYPTQLTELIRSVPELTQNYLLPSLFDTRKTKNSRSKQLMLNQSDIDPSLLAQLHEQYLELSNRDVQKVENVELNNYISDLFKQLSTYALLTEGFSSQKATNLSEVVGQEDLLQIGTFNNINQYVNDKLSKKLDPNGKPKYLNFLNAFSKNFFRNRLGLYIDETNNWNYARTAITNTKEYLIEDKVVKPVTPENIDNVKYLKKVSDNYYIININGVTEESKVSPDKSFKSKTMLEYADMYSDVTFILDKKALKTLGLTNLIADNIKVVGSPEALMGLNIQGAIALPANGLDPMFNEAIATKFGILNRVTGVMDKANLTDIINSDSLLVTSDIVNLIRAKAVAVLDELNNACNI